MHVTSPLPILSAPLLQEYVPADAVLEVAADYAAGPSLALRFDRMQAARLIDMTMWRETGESRHTACESVPFPGGGATLILAARHLVVTIARDAGKEAEGASTGRHRVAAANGGKVQAEYLASVQNISFALYRRVMAHAAAWHQANGSKLRFSLAGHGAGGALAALLASEWLHAGYFASPALGLETVVTFGEPAIANKSWAEAFDQALAASGSRYWRIVNDRDPVPGSMLIKEQAGHLVYIAHDGHFFVEPSQKLVSYRRNYETRHEATA